MGTPGPDVGTGALIPQDQKWKEGVTAAGIAFVAQAEEVIKDLQKKIDSIKKKETVLTEYQHIRLNFLNMEVGAEG